MSLTVRTLDLTAGDGTVIAGDDGVALFGCDATHASIQAALAAILADAPFGTVVQALAAGGIAELPPFALAVREGNEVRMLVRDGAQALIDTDTYAEGDGLRADGLSTWLESSVEGPQSITLSLDGADGGATTSSLAGGIASGRRVHLRWSAEEEPSPKDEPAADEAPAPLAAPPAPTQAAETPIEAPAFEEPAQDRLDDQTRQRSGAKPAPSPALPPPPPPPAPRPLVAPMASASPAVSGLIDSVPGMGSAPPAPAATPPTTTPPPPPPPPPPPITLPAPPAAPAVSARDPDPAPPSPPAVPAPAPTAPPPPAPAPASAPPVGFPQVQRPSPTAKPSPSAAPQPTAPPQPNAPPPPTDEGPGEPSGSDEAPTITLSALRQRRAAEKAAATAAEGDVQAIHCPRGHPNPANAGTCRTCGAAFADRSVSLIAQPTLGVLRLPDGNTVTLNGPKLLGRRPPTDVVLDGVPAEAIVLPDPDRVLSRVHVEIRVAGWQVQVMDRDSLNHTSVEVPGNEPLVLRAAQRYPIPVGTIIELGESVRCTYEIVPE